MALGKNKLPLPIPPPRTLPIAPETNIPMRDFLLLCFLYVLVTGWKWSVGRAGQLWKSHDAEMLEYPAPGLLSVSL